MKTRHLLSYFSLVLALGTAALPAGAAVAVAAGDRGTTFTLTEAEDTDQAKQEAIEGCAKGDDNCRAIVWDSAPGAVAIVKSSDGVATAVIDPKPEVARRDALKNCRKKHEGCRFAALYWEPGVRWAAFAVLRNDKGELLVTRFHSNAASAQDAEQAALENCQASDAARQSGRRCEVLKHWRGKMFYALADSGKGASGIGFGWDIGEARADALKTCKEYAAADDPCKVTKTVDNPGSQPEPKNFRAVAAQVDKAPPARQPARIVNNNVERTTCTNQCVNGSCLRTFPNGRTERWQAPRVFDPLANDWKWDTNSCGR